MYKLAEVALISVIRSHYGDLVVMNHCLDLGGTLRPAMARRDQVFGAVSGCIDNIAEVPYPCMPSDDDGACFNDSHAGSRA